MTGLTRKGIADEIDRLDAEISALQTDKAEIFAAYRDQLKAKHEKEEVALEIASLKAAIRKRQKIVADGDAVTDRDARIDAILVEIGGVEDHAYITTRAHAQARESSRGGEQGTIGSPDTASPRTAAGVVAEPLVASPSSAMPTGTRKAIHKNSTTVLPPSEIDAGDIPASLDRRKKVSA